MCHITLVLPYTIMQAFIPPACTMFLYIIAYIVYNAGISDVSAMMIITCSRKLVTSCW